jgi:hypothetical protein
VQPYPGPGEKKRLSLGGAWEPIWTADGRELLYRYTQQKDFREKFYSVALSFNPLRAEAPRELFETQPGEYETTGGGRDWDVSKDGRRFLLLRRKPNDKPVDKIHVVLNWTEDLKRLAPAKNR